jgi:rhodanese-related sulfurtransferase
MKLVTRTSIAIVIACVSAFSAAIAADSPNTVSGAISVTASEAKALFDKGAAFIDVRKNSDWEAGRVPGAIHLELNSVFSKDALLDEVDIDELIVIYCNGHKCLRSSQAANQAVEWGFTQVHYFRDGLPGWKAGGYSVE